MADLTKLLNNSIALDPVKETALSNYSFNMSSSPNLSTSTYTTEESTQQIAINNASITNKLRKGAWTLEEDSLLRSLIIQQETKIKWSKIGAVLKSRTGKQCRERWFNHLSPSVNKTPFTKEENEIILEQYNKIGPKWATISKLLNGRPDNAIKNHFNTILNPNKKSKLKSGSKRLKRQKENTTEITSVNVTNDENVEFDISKYIKLEKCEPADPFNLFDHFFHTTDEAFLLDFENQFEHILN